MTARLNSSSVNRHVGIALRLAREERRVTTEHLAARIGLSVAGVRCIEQGIEEANAVDLHLIAQVLNVDVSAFFCGLQRPGLCDPDVQPAEIAFADLLNATIGVRVRRAREERVLTISDVARRTGIRVQRLRRIERGGTEAAASELHALAVTLGVAVSFFFDGNAEAAEQSSCNDRPYGFAGNFLLA